MPRLQERSGVEQTAARRLSDLLDQIVQLSKAERRRVTRRGGGRALRPPLWPQERVVEQLWNRRPCARVLRAYSLRIDH